MMNPVLSNPELETEVLKAMMYENDPNSERLMQAMDLLDFECFTSINKRLVFAEMMKMHVKGEFISQADMMAPLESIDSSLMSFVVAEMGDRYTSNSLIPWANKLCELRDKRKYREMLQESINNLDATIDKDECLEIINSIPDKILNIQNNNPLTDRGMFSARECYALLKKSRENSENITLTGLSDLDNHLGGGFRKGSLIAIGAPPSAGKTQFATKLIWQIAKNNPEKESLIFSLEMNKEAITEKMLEHISHVPIKKMTEEERDAYGEIFSESKIHICDRSPVSTDFIRSFCKRSQMRGGISVILVDYLDRMKKPSANNLRTDEKLAEINIALANIAKDFNCLVILLTQLNKAAINKADKRPTMNDSKNTNGTAESADYWFGLKRIGQWDIGEKFADSNLFELIIDKVRIGQDGIIYFNLNHGYLHQEINQDFARQLVQEGNIARGNYGSKNSILANFQI